MDNRELAERARRLTLMNNLYMAKFFDGQPRCVEAVLRAVLGRPTLEVVDMSVERELVSIGARSIWLDVSAVDAEGRHYDIEVQRDPTRARPQRARFYAALLDADALAKGEDFGLLPECYVVFITDGIALNGGAPLERIERVRLETGLLFEDGSHIVYVDATYNYGDTDLGAVMHDFICADPAAMRCPVLAERARYLKETEEGVREMDDVGDEIFREGMEAGLEQGLEQGRDAAIAKLVADGTLPVEKIAAIFETTVEEVAGCAQAQGSLQGWEDPVAGSLAACVHGGAPD